jgi:undecaprenyl-diphosphatase
MKQALLYWFSALGLLVAGSWLVCPGGACVATGLDRSGLELARALAGPDTDRFMAAATWLGSIWLLLPLAGLAVLRLWLAHRRRQAVFLLLALLGATALAQLFKHGVQRPRPDLFPPLAGLPADASYPSAHTMQAVAVALAVAVLAGRRWPWLPSALLVLAALVAWSRVHLQVHFPTDVLAGALAAALWVAGLKHLLLAAPGKGG